MIERRPLNLENKSKTKSITPVSPAQLALFGPPQLLAGEDAAAYDQLVARVCAVVNPLDFIEKMFIADVVSLEWEVLRWRRLKTSLIQARGLKALERFLSQNLADEEYAEQFADDLAAVLLEELLDDREEDVQTLARECAQHEPDAIDKVNKVFASADLNLYGLKESTRADKAKELVLEYSRHEPDAVRLVEELLAGAGVSMDSLVADALVEELDSIERFDRLTTIAESRRNISLHEIERRRAVLGEALRRSVREIEDGEFEEIETTPGRGKNAA
jgi:hypothetical protein